MLTSQRWGKRGERGGRREREREIEIDREGGGTGGEREGRDPVSFN